MEGDDAVHHGIEDGLELRGTVAQRLLDGIFIGDIAKNQDGAHHLTVAVANRCATVGNRRFNAIAGNQYRVVGQTLYSAMRQGFHHWDGGRLARFLVDDVKNFIHGATAGGGLCPASELFSHRIQARHPSLGISGDHPIANGIKRDVQLFFAIAQGQIDLL